MTSQEVIKLTHEEALVALIGLERYKKPNYWQAKAIKTIVDQMGLSPNALAERTIERMNLPEGGSDLTWLGSRHTSLASLKE